jgi:peptide-methionine (S)-S-oxide reductase
VNRQGPDSGPSYRSAIFPQNAAQAAAAKAFIARLNASHAYKAPIATKIEHGGFYPAEAYHQDFARKHPFYPYIVVNDRPKVAALRQRFPNLYKG